MNGNNAATGSRRARTVKVAPITRAVRFALATSATALALAGTAGSAFAQDCTLDSSTTVTCTGAFTDTVSNAPTFPEPPPADLTVVLGDGAVPTSVAPATQGAAGLDANWAGSVSVITSADITTDSGDGIHAAGPGSVSIDNSGSISTYNNLGGAMALDISALGDIDIVNSGSLDSVSEYYNVTTVRAVSTGVGDVSIDNQASGSIIADGHDGNATAVFAFANSGDATIDNAGSIGADAKYGDGIGVHAYSYDGHAGVNNAGTIHAESSYGLADGIFASGVTTGVANSGDIRANGHDLDYVTWASAIEAYAVDDATVTNSGSLEAYASDAYGQSFGVHASSGSYGAVTVVNDAAGSIDAESSKYYGHSAGILANGGIGGVSIDNAGGIVAYGAYVNGIEAVSLGNIAVGNSGAISAEAPEGFTTGILTMSALGDIAVDNSGSIDLDGYFGAIGIEALATSYGGTVGVVNRGGINAVSGYDTYGVGIGVIASGDSGVDVHNTADGTIHASGDYQANGVVATTFAGDANVLNDGDVQASAAGAKYSAAAIGVDAFALNGTATVTNTGSISAVASSETFGSSTGISAGGVAADVFNSGVITTDGLSSTGISAQGSTGDVNVLNEGSIHATADKYSNGIGIRGFSVYGDVNLTNSSDGLIAADGDDGAAGLSAVSLYGDVVLINDGDIDLGPLDPSARAQPNIYGMYGGSLTGDVTAINSGTILAETASNPFGIYAVTVGADSTIAVENSGVIQAIGQEVGVWGIYTQAVGGGDIVVHNSDTVESSTGLRSAKGIWAYAGQYNYYGGTLAGDVSVVNEGTITTSTFSGPVIDPDPDNPFDTPSRFALLGSRARGIEVGGLNVEVANAGSITADAFTWAAGVEAYGADSTTVTSSGDISVRATADYETFRIYGDAFGIRAAGGGDVQVAHTGTIAATSDGRRVTRMYYGVLTDFGGAAGIFADSADGDVSVDNRGGISATNTAAYGVANGIVASAYGDVAIDNAGDVLAVANNDHAFAAAVQMESTNGISTLDNSGSVSVEGTDGSAWTVFGGDRVEAINNTGDITGAVSVAGGNDVFNNGNGGVWHLDATRSTDFGDGDDRFANASGGTLVLADSGITFGAGQDSLGNAGTIKVGGDSFIDLTDGSAEALAAALKRPKSNPAFTNNGTIDMLDGAADDILTITGSFGGNGYVNLDVSLDNQLNDKLVVAGGVLNGTKQFVNIVLLDGLPSSDDVGKQLELAHVSGDTNPSIFQPGQVLGVSPSDFLSLGLELTGTPIDGSIGASYNLTVETLVNGLNAAGVLASSAALGVDSLMTSTTGSWDERGYSLSADGNTPAFATIVPWVRSFRDEGGMSPDHLSGNFGQMSASRLSQDNFGTEMGLELRAANGFRFGTLFSKSEGRQYLVDERGMDTIRGSTLGLYGTWVSPRGFYADASWRTMRFEANLDSAGGRQRTDGNAVTSNVEAGYSWKLGNGVNVQPQLGYTATTVDGLRIHGDQATFESQDANWKRGRAGVSLSKTYGGTSGWRWMPRAEFDIVRTFEGVASYSINDDYFGNVMTEGTSAMVKLGLGASRGRLSWNGGVNWMDGATFDAALGGQMTLRYSW